MKGRLSSHLRASRRRLLSFSRLSLVAAVECRSLCLCHEALPCHGATWSSPLPLLAWWGGRSLLIRRCSLTQVKRAGSLLDLPKFAAVVREQCNAAAVLGIQTHFPATYQLDVTPKSRPPACPHHPVAGVDSL